MGATIYFCFAYSNWIERVLGRGGTEIAVRLSAFILFCLGVQIVWTGKFYVVERREVQRSRRIVAILILWGLHHQYMRL